MRPRQDGSAALSVTKVTLTQRRIDTMKPGSRVYKEYDDKQRGLVVQMQPTGHAAFKFYYSHHGRPRWYHIAATNAVSLDEARRIAAGIAAQVARREDPQAQLIAQRAVGSFKELADAFLSELHGKPSTVEQYRNQLKNWALPLWGSLPADAIGRDDIEALFNKRKKQTVSSAKLLLATLKAVFSFAMHDPRWRSRITSNPAHGIGSAKRDKSLKYVPRERYLNDGEIPSFWHGWVVGGPAPCLALRLLLLTGQRPGEVAAMQPEQIAGNWWTIPSEIAKNSQSHRVWLTPMALDIAKEFLAERVRVRDFTDKMSRLMKVVSDDLCVDPATPHDLRRTHGTMVCGALHFTRDQMNRIQNHKEGGIADVYDKSTYADEARTIQEAVASRIMLLLGGADNVIDFRAA